jgi:magnesium chelatase subunit I
MRPNIRTLGALKETGYRPRTVREEVRENVISELRSGGRLFPDIVGYEKTVIPQLVNALLSRHDILLLGLRGQAKTRLARSLACFLDEWVPVVAGSSLNEDPLRPATGPTTRRIQEAGDELPIDWLHREERYQEKLATPDVSMADLIGDIDPIRASRERLDLSDERVIHFGLIPRTNRGVFCLNELPDLQPRIQVGMLNILEERDVQIRGFPIRLRLDLLIVFTANPEDYTNRGNIITPLKDRIASQVLTHYPETLDDALRITSQEAELVRSVEVRVPRFMREVVEEIAIQARRSEHVDQASGVSARLPISAMEVLVSNVERRRILTGDRSPVPRLCDLFALLPAITGKLELVYEGEQEGATIVATRLIGEAIKTVFLRYFPAVHQERKGAGGAEPLYEKVQSWFAAGKTITITDHLPSEPERAALRSIPGLRELADKYLPAASEDEAAAVMELVLEGMHQHSVLAREGLYGSARYGDMLTRMMQDL